MFFKRKKEKRNATCSACGKDLKRRWGTSCPRHRNSPLRRVQSWEARA